MEDVSVISGAVTDGNWRLAALLGIILITKLITQFKKYWAPLGSGSVAWGVAVLSGVGAAMLPCVIAGQSLGTIAWLTLAVDGALTGLASAGLYRGAQKINEDRKGKDGKDGKDDLLPFPAEAPITNAASHAELKSVALGKIELKKADGTSSDAETPVEKPKK